jgi:hypothetical protein
VSTIESVRPSTDTPMTPAKVRELWERSSRATRTERQQAAVNASFLRNRQWVYWNRGSDRLEELPREPSRVRATVPKMGPDSRRIIAKLMRRPLMFDVPPTSPDDAATRASRIGEAALVQAQRERGWEQIRHLHAQQTWEAGVAGICVEWDWTAGAPIGTDERGRTVHTGQEKLTVCSLHEIACEPGTRDIERARWWIRGVALPPPEVRDLYGLDADPAADARAVDLVWRLSDTERTENVPLTMVLTYYERPMGDRPGQVLTVVGSRVVDVPVHRSTQRRGRARGTDLRPLVRVHAGLRCGRRAGALQRVVVLDRGTHEARRQRPPVGAAGVGR